MTAPAIVIRQCSDRSWHGIHVSDPRPSMHECEEGRTIRYLCGGDSLGDRRIREADDLQVLVAQLDDPACQDSDDPSLDCDGPDDYDPDPDGYLADEAADRYFAHHYL